MHPPWSSIRVGMMKTMDSTLQGHLISPFNLHPSKPPFEEIATTLGEQPELNDSVAAVHLVILSLEMKKKLKKKKKVVFSLGGLISDCHCYDHFFLFIVLFHCSSFPFILVNSSLPPRTSISTDWFSHADYIVPLTHRFFHILSLSMMMHPLGKGRHQLVHACYS